MKYQSKKIRLRPLQRNDAKTTLSWRNDPAIRDNTMGFRFPVTEEMEEAWFDKHMSNPDKSHLVFAIENLKPKKLIGFTQLTGIDWISRHATFGIAIGEKSFHGKGVAKDAMTILFQHAFELLGLRKICLEVPAYNQAAIRAYEKFGFKKEGALKEHLYFEGQYHDIVLMAYFDQKK